MGQLLRSSGLIFQWFIDLLCINLNIHMLCINLNINESHVKPYILSKIHLRLFLYTVSTAYKNKNMDELPTREIHTIKIGNYEFRTYNLLMMDLLEQDQQSQVAPQVAKYHHTFPKYQLN